LGKLKESSEIKHNNFLKTKENDEKQFNENLSKFVGNLMKKEEFSKSRIKIN